MQDFLLTIMLSGAGAGLFLLILARIIPNKKLYAICLNAGKFITDKGRSKLGIAFWKPSRKFIVDSLGTVAKGLSDGLSYHNNLKEKK